MVGSTQLSEQLDAEEYRQIIIEYHQVVEQIIKRYSGHVASYLGDGLLVYFGYPEGLEDAPKVSIQAGLSCIEAIVKANRDWETEGRNPLKIRIGIHTGLVVVDDHLALGDTVNIAARLEALAPHNGMVISNQTLKLAQGWFEFESLGEHSLKGISEPMEVFRVLKETGAKSPLEAAKSRGLSPLVGRQAELDVLKAHWLQAKTGQGDLTLLNGEAGIGKSRLVDAIKEQIILDGDIWVAEARCSAYHRNSSFYPIIDLLGRAVLQFEQNDPPEAKLKKLKDFLQDTDLDLQLAMPLFAEFLSIPSEEYPPPMMSPFAKKQKRLEGLTQ
jgi:class 3 adenylate cyclase